MNINVTSNQENNTNDTKMEWQTPVLYKEDWINTMNGSVTVEEAGGDVYLS